MDSDSPEDFDRDGHYRVHPYTHQGSTYDDHRRPQYFSHGLGHQASDKAHPTGDTDTPQYSQYRATTPHAGQYDRGDVSTMEQRFDQQFQYTSDTQRESANSTHQVTTIHTLNPTKHVMPQHNSYHGDISGQEAERILTASPKRNCYLTRFSNNSNMYTLSVIYVYKNQDKVKHLKLSIDNERKQHTLEGTGEEFPTLDALLKHYESNPLNPEIRNLGSPCLPLESQNSVPQESSRPSDPSINMIEAFTKLNEAHMKQMSEQRKYFDEKLEKEQQRVTQILENQQKIEEKRQEKTQKELQKLIETIQQQKVADQQRKLEEERKKAEEKRFLELKQEMEQQNKKFEEELKKKKGGCIIS